jgi:hypothetical protein
MLLRILPAALLASVSLASPSADVTAVCQYLESQYPAYFAWDPKAKHPSAASNASMPVDDNKGNGNASVYNEINRDYWNNANSKLRAACAFFPGNADQVADAVKQLGKYLAAPYGLKSGGHQPAPGFSATDHGVLISFEPNMAATTRTEDGQHFWVGPGARWGDVYNVTGETNQVVVGGRLANIGVGGFTLGGGLSYYSAQYVRLPLICTTVEIFY